MGSYVPGTEQERTEMLREIGFVAAQSQILWDLGFRS